MSNNTTSGNLTSCTNKTGTGEDGPGSWRPPMPTLSTEDIVFNVVFSLLAVMIIFGNSLMIGAFRVNRKLHTGTNLLLVSLAVADLLVGLISVPLRVYIYITYALRGSLYKFYLMFDIIAVVSSVLHLTAISLERCYSLVWPVRHRSMRKSVVLAISVVAWILAILAGSMGEFLGEFYGMILVAVFFFVPFMVILGAYGKIAQVARAHAHGRGNLTFKKDLRIATTLAIVIGLFVICWTPTFAVNFLFSFCFHKRFMTPMCQGLMRLPPKILKISKVLWYANSMCNPIIYGLRKNEFRQAFRKILRGLFCKKGGAR